MKKLLLLLIIPFLSFGQIDYESQIQPILNVNCIECHQGEAAYAGGLSLTSYEELLQGGYTDYGIILTGLLGEYVTTGYMPAYGSGNILSESEINLITQWISEGALNNSLNFAIEGRWIPEPFSNTMYEFEDGLRYTYYGDNDSSLEYWQSLDISDAIPNPHSYTFDGSTLIIDLNFGNYFEDVITFECDENIINFNNSQWTTWTRLGTEPSDCESTSVIENNKIKNILKKTDFLGKETSSNKGLQLHIYDDGSVEKKYLIK